MKLKDTRETYSYHSRKTSEIVRHLGLVGVGLIWIFRYGQDGKEVVPPELITPGIFLVVGLGLDLFHSASSTAIWGIFNRYKEVSGTKDDTEFLAPRQLTGQR